MACYYLVISSTHLSKGHFRSIKGVFRGPLCRSAGGESPDYAVKERAIAKALEDLKANFYCELCDKQYQKHQEFDNHINSYDHAHKQRLKELKQREFSRNVASKTWKDERKQERALKRLHQLARLKQQSESPVKRAKSRSTTVRGRDRQHQARVQPQVKSRPEHASTHSSPGVLPSTPGSVWSKDLPSIGSPSSLIPPKQPSICPQGSSPSPEPLASSRNSRAGVSFCFSKRAHLKLDSCASVFSDGQDETSDCEDLHRQRQKLALWSRSPSPSSGHDNLHPIPAQTAPPMTDGDATLQREADTEDRRQGGGLEAKATFPGTAEADKLGSPLIHSADRQPVGIEDRLRDQQQKPSVEEASRGLEEGEYLDVLCPTVYTDGQGGRDQSQLQRPEDMQIHIHGGSRQDGGLDSEDCLSETEHRGQEMKTWCRETNEESHASFFNVLGKDGVTMLRWPCELLQYTSDEPRISYSCNPLYFNFKVTEGKERSTRDELTDVKNTDRQSDLSARAQAQPQDLPGDKLRILKPKIPKNKKVGKHGAWGRKLDAVKRFREDCALNVCSQSEVGDCFEFRADQTGALPNKRGRTNKRHKTGKRSGSLKDESSNETDMPEHSLKSIVVNLFSKPLPKRKRRQTVRKFVSALRLVRRQPSPDFPRCTTPRENHCQWHHDFHGSRIDASRTPTSEKSWSGWSDLTSDGEGAAVRWEGFSAVPEANYRSPWRNESSHLRSYISTPSSNLSCYGYRYKECSPNIDGEYGSEDHWDYRHAHIYRKRTFSAVCDSTPFVERNRRCSTRRHNRSFEKCKYKDYRGPSISRDLCSYRVFEGPDLQNLDKNLSSSRIRPHRRRGRERLGVLRPNFKERSKAKTCKRPRSRSRCSPSSSSSTSISELSGDWSCHPLQSSHFEPSIVKDAPNSEYTQTLSQLIHCTSVRHTDRPNIPSASCNEEGKDQLSISPPVISTDTNCGILDAMERKSGSPLNSNSSVLQMKSNLKDKNLTLKRASTFPSFPLIGKLPAMRKGMRKGRNPPKKSSGCQDLFAVSADALPALQSVNSVPAHTAGHVSSENPKQTKEERQSPSQTLATVVPLNEEVTTTPCAIASILTGENISLSLNNHASCQEDRGSPNSRPLRCSTPPLAEKPITFSEDEIDKYRLLQLQAQQHMQQLHQEEEDEGMEEPQTQLGAAHLDSFPLPAEQTSNQHVPPPCLQYTILQHRALSALSTFSSPTSASPCPRSSLLPHISSSLLIPPLPPSLHQTPFIPFPFSATFLPAHPAPILATHPLHLIPSPSLQPPPPTQPHRLTLHPLCPASLLPAVLTPTPMAAAAAAVAAAASTLRIRPLQHPLYHSADLQHQPRPAS